MRPGALNLLYQTTRASFLAQEKNSALGMLWHLLNPLALALVIYVVFSHFSAFGDIPHYPLFILIGVIQFNFFTQAGARAAEGMLRARPMVLSTTVPREILVLRSVAIDATTYVIELVFVLVLVALFGDGLTWNALLYPVVFIGMTLVTLGAAFVLAAAVVFLTDLLYVWGVGSRMLFFLTPIFYASEMIDEPTAARVIAANPLAAMIELGRRCVLDGKPLTWTEAGVALVGPALVFLLGWFVFRRLNRHIPDFI
jgi:homopolymeric O-antigen transport system permease protein